MLLIAVSSVVPANVATLRIGSILSLSTLDGSPHDGSAIAVVTLRRAMTTYEAASTIAARNRHTAPKPIASNNQLRVRIRAPNPSLECRVHVLCGAVAPRSALCAGTG